MYSISSMWGVISQPIVSSTVGVEFDFLIGACHSQGQKLAISQARASQAFPIGLIFSLRIVIKSVPDTSIRFIPRQQAKSRHLTSCIVWFWMRTDNARDGKLVKMSGRAHLGYNWIVLARKLILYAKYIESLCMRSSRILAYLKILHK